MEYKKMKNKTDLLVFTGMLFYERPYTRYCSRCIIIKGRNVKIAAIPPELENGIKLTIKEKNARTHLVQSDEGKVIFDRIQDRVKNALILHYPNMKISCKHKFLLKVDTSLTQTGASLWQQKLCNAPFESSEEIDTKIKQIKEDYHLISVYS